MSHREPLDLAKPNSMPRRRAGIVIGLLAAILLPCGPATAQIGSERYSSIVIEAQTGRVISAVNPDEPRYPASLTKMMTLYIVFESLRDRRIGLRQNVPISAHASAMSPTKLGVVPGSRLSVEEAILGLVTKSANDAAAALGELLGGEETRFAQMMTLRARSLGMRSTTFRNASGLPDFEQVTTARDMATLGRRLVYDFPQEYRYFAVTSFRFRGRSFPNHDQLLERYPGADGIKTGYIEASGFNLVSSAVRGDTRLVAVVMGAARGGERDLHMMALLDQGFGKLGVPVAARPAPSRLPSLVASAQAGTLLALSPRPARWSVQVGAFATDQAARQAAQTARRIVVSGDARSEPVRLKGKTSYRALLVGLTAAQVQGACPALARHRIACTPIRPEAGQLASR